MKKYKRSVLLIFMPILIGITAFFSCTYEKGEMNVECNLPNTVSFSQDIIPIFNAECSTVGCHTTADHAGSLNLEAAVAYSQLLSPGSGYVDTLNPEFSVLYSKLITASNPMPPSGKLDDCKIKLVLKWIQEKAKNN